MKKAKAKNTIQPEILKLDIGCGMNPQDGFIGVDISPDCKAAIVHDVRKPWPWADNSVDEIYCSHFLEHLDGMERIFFMNEAYRVMKAPYERDGLSVTSKMLVITPAPFTHRYMQDPTHKFPMVVQESYNYFSKTAREQMGLTHYPINCDFEWSGFFQENAQAFPGRNDEFKQFAARHYINSLDDLIITLVKK